MKKAFRTQKGMPEVDYAVLNRLTDRAFYMALKMIDIANNRPDVPKGEPKVGGHPAACASSQHILSAIHLVLREPEDYFACKPHVSPIDHSLNFLLHQFKNPDGSWMEEAARKQTMHHLRHYSSEGLPVFQSYHAESDPDSFRFFPSGSVGIPPVNALYQSLAYEFAKDHGIALNEEPTFWCLMGDSEFREGSLMEAMPDGGERELSNLVWIVDFNRQNLDGTRVLNEDALGGSDADRIVGIARSNGWDGVILKHGKIRERLFAKPGGEEFKRVLDEEFTDFEFQALLGAKDAKLTRKVLEEKSAKLKAFFKKLSDQEVHEAFTNLAGHDLECLVEALWNAKTNRKRPTLLVIYTIKGYGLQCAAQSGNHSALPEADELEEIGVGFGVDLQDPFTSFPAASPEEAFLKKRRAVLLPGIDRLLEAAQKRREEFRRKASEVSWPVDFEIGALKFNPVAHTQWMWGQIAAKLDRLGRGQVAEDKLTENDRQWKALASMFLTMAPDVGSSTNTSPNMNGKLYGDIEQEDFEKKYGAKDEKAPDVVPSQDRKSGHLRFEIAEGNCMSAAGSFGKMWHFTGVPFFPAMTIYDFFIKRAHDQFYYNLYWHSHFATIGTPSGITLAPEGAQHSWKSDFQIPYCVTWEPCFAKEMEWILADTLRRHFTGDDKDRESVLIRCVTKGMQQKDFTDRLKTHQRFIGLSESEILEVIRQEALEGAYPLIDYRGQEDYTPGDNVLHIFAMSALVAEAMKASDLLRDKGIFANVFVVTSPDLLLSNFAEFNDYKHLRETLGINGDLHLNPKRGSQIDSAADYFSLRSARVPILSVHDGEPGLLDNLGSVVGVPQQTLAVRKTSKSGTTKDIFHLHHLDAESIAASAEALLTRAAGQNLNVHRTVLQSLAP